MSKIDKLSTDTKRRIPLTKISFAISPMEKEQLAKIAEEKGLTLSAMCRRAIQAYLYAVRSRERKVDLKNH